MDLVCANMLSINFMVSARFIAYGITGLLVFSVPDRFGRKWTLAITNFIMVVAQLLMIFVPTYEARFVGFVLFGVAMLKQSLPYVYIAEVVPPSNVASTSVTMTSFDLSVLMIFNLYLLLISRSWFPIALTMTILSTIAFIYSVIFIPESPVWLLSQGRVDEAIDSFNQIAKINGVSARIPKGTNFQDAADLTH